MNKDETNILKAWAIIAVVILHFNAFLFGQTRGLGWNIVLIVDQFVRFSVPLFMALSGYSLAKRYLISLSLKDFYLRRLVKLLPDYILWSLVIYFGMRLAFGAPLGINLLNLPDIFRTLLRGQADYQLYFVPTIFQLYVIFPLLFFLMKKFPWPILIFSLMVQAWSYPNYFFTQDQEQYRMIITWIFYFILGIFLAEKEDVLTKKKFSILLPILLVLVGYAWEQIDAASNIAKRIDVIFVTKTSRLPVLMYGTGFILGGSLLARKLLSLPQKVVNILTFIGVQSYIIYLSHTMVLRLIFARIAPEVNQGNVFIIAAAVIVGLLLTILPGVLKKLPVFQPLGQKA